MIQAGSNSLSGIYVGGTAISAVFVGSTKVWPNTPLSPYTMLTKVSFNDSQNSSNYNVYDTGLHISSNAKIECSGALVRLPASSSSAWPGAGNQMFGTLDLGTSDRIGRMEFRGVYDAPARKALWQFVYGSTAYKPSMLMSTERVSIKIDKNACYVNDTLVHTFDALSWGASSGTVYIGTAGRKSSADKLYNNIWHGDIYYLNIYENEVLVSSCVPAQRNSDNAIGFYDTTRNIFLSPVSLSALWG